MVFGYKPRSSAISFGKNKGAPFSALHLPAIKRYEMHAEVKMFSVSKNFEHVKENIPFLTRRWRGMTIFISCQEEVQKQEKYKL